MKIEKTLRKMSQECLFDCFPFGYFHGNVQNNLLFFVVCHFTLPARTYSKEIFAGTLFP